MIGASVKTVNFKRTRKALKRIEDRLEKPTGFLATAGARGHREIIRHFAEEEDEKGKMWENLAVSTLAARRVGLTPKKLVDTGRMRAAIIWSKFGKSGVRFLALVKYAIYHVKGTDKMPKRNFMYFPSAFLKKLARGFSKYVTK